MVLVQRFCGRACRPKVRTSFCIYRHFSISHRLKQNPDAKSEVRPAAWESYIGLEIHAQILCNSKLFSGSGTQFAALTNSQVSLFDAAFPGTLPVINRECVEAALKTALALNCHINKVSKFDRKHYFYADLPQGYQITQQRLPIAVDGYMDYAYTAVKPPTMKRARIFRIQLEQDSGKSVHDPKSKISLIDLNRAGVALMEIVTAPDFRTAEDAAQFARDLHLLLTTIGTCTGKMNEGAMRVDATISVNPVGEPMSWGVRTEIKNIPSIRGVARAADYEIKRHIRVLESGGTLNNETRMFDSVSGKTIAMRDKEKLHDYRFMAEPNLPPLRLYNNDDIPPGVSTDQIVNIDEVHAKMPQTPQWKREMLQEKYGVTLHEAITMVAHPGAQELFEEVMSVGTRCPNHVYKTVSADLSGRLQNSNLTFLESPVNAQQLGELVDLVSSDVIVREALVKILELLVDSDPRSVTEIIEENKWKRMSKIDMEKLAEEIIEEYPKLVSKYKKGKTSMLEGLAHKAGQKFFPCVNQKEMEGILKEKLAS